MILGRIKQGKVVVSLFFARDLAKLEGREVEIKKLENTRSAQANRYYWACVVKLISEHTGFTPDEVHEVFKKRFLSYKKKVKGKVYEFTRSTTELKISEFQNYIEQVKEYATRELDVLFPDEDILM